MSAAKGQAQQAEYNATVARINARTERQKGFVQQEQIGQKYDKIQGEGIANAAGNGTDPSYGSAALVIFGEGGMNRSGDQGRAYVNAESNAVGHENKARDLEMQAKNARQAGMFGAATSFLGGLGGALKGAGGSGNSNLING